MAHSIIITKWIMIFILSIFMKSQILIHGQQQVPCLFIMGDSILDNGNNNMLATIAKANYPPYGIDYPDGPTGRFTNGKNIADFLAALLGFSNPVPPFANAKGSSILKGLNYASGAAGILDESGILVGDRISLNRQLLNHKVTLGSLAILLGNRTRFNDFVSKCLYVVNMGSNDYINNYLQPRFYPSGRLYTPDQFAERLIRKYSQQLRNLYEDGARKIAVFGLGLLGCIPQELAAYPVNASGCVDFINNWVQLFNNRLVPLVDNLNANLPGAKFIYINVTSISLGDPSALGFKVANAPCCVVSNTGQCAPGQVPCSNRSEYIFFDNFHPTEILNQVTATRSYSAMLPADAYPYDIQRLVQQ